MADLPDPAKTRSVLVIGSIGIGNLLMFRPTLKQIRVFFPSAKVSLIVLKGIFAELFKDDPLVDEVIPVDFKKDRSPGRVLKLIQDLRSRKFEVSITGFPANRTEYNVLAFLAGAPVRITHRCPKKKLRSLSFLQNVRIPLVPGFHDVLQNLNLLKHFGPLPDPDIVRMEFPLSETELAFGPEYVQEHNIAGAPLLVGMHPGSSEEHMMVYKRWAPHKFARLIRELQDNFGARVLLFGGPDELEQMRGIAALCDTRPDLVTGLTLRQAAAVIGRCRLFVTNDSGLMHIAVTQEVPTVAVFGPTDHVRTAPFGKAHRVVRRGLACSPCWALKEVGTRRKCIYPSRRCLDELDTGDVLKVIKELLQ